MPRPGSSHSKSGAHSVPVTTLTPPQQPKQSHPGAGLHGSSLPLPLSPSKKHSRRHQSRAGPAAPMRELSPAKHVGRFPKIAALSEMSQGDKQPGSFWSMSPSPSLSTPSSHAVSAWASLPSWSHKSGPRPATLGWSRAAGRRTRRPTPRSGDLRKETTGDYVEVLNSGSAVRSHARIFVGAPRHAVRARARVGARCAAGRPVVSRPRSLRRCRLR